MKIVNYRDIIKAHKIKEVKVVKSSVVVFNGAESFNYCYSSSKIAKAVGNKLNMFKGMLQ